MDFQSVEYVLRAIHRNVDGFAVKSRVDEDGIESFISHCAKLSAGTGFAAGSGGVVTMAALVGVDIANYWYQQIRITIGVIYHRTGNYRPDFEDVIYYMAIGLGVRIAGAVGTIAGVHAGKAAVTKLAEKQLVRAVVEALLKRVPASMSSRVLPGLGGLIAGGANYFTLRGYGKALLKVDELRFG